MPFAQRPCPLWLIRALTVPTVSIERILRWYPEVILVQGNYPPAER